MLTKLVTSAIKDKMTALKERIENAIHARFERKVPSDIVVPKALELWNVVAPERLPTLEAHTAMLPITLTAKRLETMVEQPTEQMRALHRILYGYEAGDEGEGMLLGELKVHPYFTPDGHPRKPFIGEPSFMLNVIRYPRELPTRKPIVKDGRIVLMITEVTDRVQFSSTVFDQRGVYTLLQGDLFGARSLVSVRSYDGPQPYYAAQDKRPCQIWDLMGFDEQADSITWVDKDDPEWIFSEGFKSLLLPPNDKWQKEFTRQTLDVLIRNAHRTPRDVWVGIDKHTVGIENQPQ